MRHDRNALEHARDQMHLAWLAISDSGKTSVEIGKAYGVPAPHVRTVLLRIKADLAKSEAA